jgi:hypothetical protein
VLVRALKFVLGTRLGLLGRGYAVTPGEGGALCRVTRRALRVTLLLCSPVTATAASHRCSTRWPHRYAAIARWSIEAALPASTTAGESSVPDTLSELETLPLHPRRSRPTSMPGQLHTRGHAPFGPCQPRPCQKTVTSILVAAPSSTTVVHVGSVNSKHPSPITHLS